jgi:hypothetical protein
MKTTNMAWFSIGNKLGSIITAIILWFVLKDHGIVSSLIGLSLIWFSDFLGSLTGPIFRGGNIDNESPGWMVCVFGWLVMLVIPVMLMIYELQY